MNIKAFINNTNIKFRNFTRNRFINFSNKLPFKRFQCNVCNSEFNHYLPMPIYFEQQFKKHGFKYKLSDFETLNYKRNMCPFCGVGDVNRLIYLYLKNNHLNKKNLKILDVAPVEIITKKLKSKKNIKYRSADLYSPLADDKVDITDMKIYNSNNFDIVICSHVLEHVKEDSKALKEIKRVLKQGGTAVLMVPINKLIEKSIEENQTFSEADNWRLYGQGDHVRLYSKKDFVKKIVEVKLQIGQLTIKDFDSKDFYKYGISKDSVLYVVRKTK